MPEREYRSHIPQWAERERLSDLAWLAENLHVLWPAAKAGFEELGRGAITVDTTLEPIPGKGNPMWYLTQQQVTESFTQDEIRMVANYDPIWQLVIILLKAQNRTSAYRMAMPGEKA